MYQRSQPQHQGFYGWIFIKSTGGTGGTVFGTSDTSSGGNHDSWRGGWNQGGPPGWQQSARSQVGGNAADPLFRSEWNLGGAGSQEPRRLNPPLSGELKCFKCGLRGFTVRGLQNHDGKCKKKHETHYRCSICYKLVETEKGRAHEMECKRRDNVATRQQGEFRDGLTKKTAVLLDFAQITLHPPPPPLPNLDNLYNFFLTSKFKILKSV